MIAQLIQFAAEDPPVWRSPPVLGAVITAAVVGILGLLAANEYLTRVGRLRRRLDKQLAILDRVDLLNDDAAKVRLARSARRDAWELVWRSERRRPLTLVMILAGVSAVTIVVSLGSLVVVIMNPEWTTNSTVIDAAKVYVPITVVGALLIFFVDVFWHPSAAKSMAAFIAEHVEPRPDILNANPNPEAGGAVRDAPNPDPTATPRGASS